MGAVVLTIGTLRPTLELAWAVAKAGTQARPPIPPPGRLRPLMRFAKLPDRALATVQQVVEDDPEFRDRVVEWADEGKLDRQAWLWLVRPDGWEHDLEIEAAAGEAGVSRLAPEKLAPEKLAPDKLAPEKLAPEKLAPGSEQAGAGESRPAAAEGVPDPELVRLQQVNAELESKLAAEREANQQADARREETEASRRQEREVEERGTTQRLAAAEQSGARAEAELVRLHQANAELAAQLTTERDVRRQAEADRDAHEVARRQALADREATEAARRQAMADRDATEAARRAADEERIRLEEAVTTLEDRVSSLGTDSRETVEQETDAGRENATARDQIALLTDQLQQARAEAARLRADRDAIEAARRQALEDREATEVARRTAEDERGRLAEAVTALEVSASSLATDRQETFEQLTQASQERQTLHDQIALLGAQLQEAHAETAQLQADRDALEVARQQAQAEREGLEVSRRQAGQEHEAVEADRRAAIEARQALEAEQRQIADERQALEAARRQLEEKLEADQRAAGEARQALEADRRQLEQERQALETDQRATAEERQAVEGDRRQVEEEREELEAERQTAAEDRSGLEESLAALQSRVASLESDLSDATEQLARAGFEQDTAGEQIAELIEQLHLARAETTRLHAGREEIRAAAGREIARAAEAARLLSEALAEAALTRGSEAEAPIPEPGTSQREVGRSGRPGEFGRQPIRPGPHRLTAAGPPGRDQVRPHPPTDLRQGSGPAKATGCEAVSGCPGRSRSGVETYLALKSSCARSSRRGPTSSSSEKTKQGRAGCWQANHGTTTDRRNPGRMGPGAIGCERGPGRRRAKPGVGAGRRRPGKAWPEQNGRRPQDAPGKARRLEGRGVESPSARSQFTDRAGPGGRPAESESGPDGVLGPAGERMPTHEQLSADDGMPDGEVRTMEEQPSAPVAVTAPDGQANGENARESESPRPTKEAGTAKPTTATPPGRPRPGAIRRRPVPLPPAIFDDSVEAATHLVRVPSILLIVDGYNVTMTSWPHLELSRQRHQLVDALAELAVRMGTLVQVVFDGADMAGRFGPPTNARRLIRVTFSPDGVEADEIIIDVIDHLDPTQAVVVATNDRQLQDGVRRRGGNVITVAQLLAVVGRTGAASESPGLRWRNRQRKGPAAK